MMITSKHLTKVVSCTIFLVFLVLAFQNCQAPLNFTNLNPATNPGLNAAGPLQTTGGDSPTTSSDHGQGYGGKPSATFFVGASDVRFSTVAYIPDAIKFSITPALPKGLNLNPITGDITGTPDAFTIEYKNYSITGVSSTGKATVIVVYVGVGQVYAINPTISGDGLSDANLGDQICADINGRCGLKAAKEQATMNSVNTRLILPDHTYLEIPAVGLTADLNIPNSVGAAAAAPVGAKLLSSRTCSRDRTGFQLDTDISLDSRVQVEVRTYADKTTKVICGFTSLSANSKSLGKSCALPITADGISHYAPLAGCDFTLPDNFITLTCNTLINCSSHVTCGKPAAEQALANMTGFNLHITNNWNYTVYSAVNYVNDGTSVVLDGKGPWECN